MLFSPMQQRFVGASAGSGNFAAPRGREARAQETSIISGRHDKPATGGGALPKEGESLEECESLAGPFTVPSCSTRETVKRSRTADSDCPNDRGKRLFVKSARGPLLCRFPNATRALSCIASGECVQPCRTEPLTKATLASPGAIYERSPGPSILDALKDRDLGAPVLNPRRTPSFPGCRTPAPPRPVRGGHGCWLYTRRRARGNPGLQSADSPSPHRPARRA